MPQRLPVVRMFNLGLLEEIYVIRYYWKRELEIKAKVRGKDCRLDLGLIGSRKEALLNRKNGLAFVQAVASVLFGATGQDFDRVHVQGERCTIWFPAHGPQKENEAA